MHSMDEQLSRSHIVTSVRLDEEAHRLVKLRLLEEHLGSFSDFVNRAMLDFLEKRPE